MEHSNENVNRIFLNKVYDFADCLLKEVLEQRCDLEHSFYLPRLPVTDEELLQALGEQKSWPQASEDLHGKWNELINEMYSENIGQNSPRMIQLCYFYGCNELWCLAVLLSFVCKCDPKYEKAFLILQGDSGRRKLDIFLVCALAYYLRIENNIAYPSLAAESRKKQELFEKVSNGELRMREYVFLWLHRQEDRKINLQGIVQVLPACTETAGIHLRELEWCSAVARRQIEETPEEQLIFELQGRPQAGKKYFCREVADRLGYKLCVIYLSAFLEQYGQQREDLLHEIFFTCRVHGCLPYLDLSRCQEERLEVMHWVKEIVSEYILIFLGVEPDSTICRKLSLFTQRFSLDKLSLEDSLSLWKWMGSRYSAEENMDYEQLAGKYRLLPGVIHEVFARAERYRWERKLSFIDFSLLHSCIRECNQFTGNSLMERMDTVFTWKDLKVEPEVIAGMRLACAHLKYRFEMQKEAGNKFPYGRGIGVLMYGPPGTGKTMAAQVIANELQMDLYRVDLSQVTSKYIGETEKNLEKIFREAEQSNVILFFDEADSMFGKRTEVKDSNDKYANQETSYILQRIESYEGMVILATNFVKNFDSAFMRRMTISIRFSPPNEAMRTLLWQDMLENTVLGEDTGLMEMLASQFELTGSNIKNIVRNAGFLALMEKRALEIGDIAKAAKIEFEKMGKIPNVSTFGMFYGYLS